MALLLVGLGGFGMLNFSGTTRTIAEVGDQKIEVNDYARAVREELRAMSAQTGEPVPFVQARAMGLDRVVLSRLVTSAALDDAAAQAGISVSDDQVREQLLEATAFRDETGRFDKERYNFVLRNNGMDAKSFEANLRRDTARGLLQGAIISATPMPATYGDTLANFIGERRDIVWAQVNPANIPTDLAEPGEEELRAFYNDHIAMFTQPETREITYTWLLPERLAEAVEISEEDLRAAYGERAERYNTPERRLVERLIFPSQSEAQDGAQRFAAGEVTFEQLVAERGLDLVDIDMGDVAGEQLGQAAVPVFALEVGEVSEVLPTDLGPALFRVNGKFAAQQTSFEQARAELQQELGTDRARRQINARFSDYEDILAAGATLEELADETDLEIGQISWAAGDSEGIAAYRTFRDTAEMLTDEDFPELISLEDGGVLAVRLDGITPAQPTPFDQAKQEVIAAWEAKSRSEALSALAQQTAAQLGEGRSFAALGLIEQHEEDLTRRAFISGTPEGFVQAAFELEPGTPRSLVDEEGAVVMLLQAVKEPDPEDEEATRVIASARLQADQGLASEILNIFATQMRARTSLRINDAAINAVNAQIQ